MILMEHHDSLYLNNASGVVPGKNNNIQSINSQVLVYYQKSLEESDHLTSQHVSG